MMKVKYLYKFELELLDKKIRHPPELDVRIFFRRQAGKDQGLDRQVYG